MSANNDPFVFCCDDMRTEIEKGQIEKNNDGSWGVNGCCGGGCYVLYPICFCPFCGKSLDTSPDETISH